MIIDHFETVPTQWDAVVDSYALGSEPLTTPYGLDTLTAVRVEPGERLQSRPGSAPW